MSTEPMILSKQLSYDLVPGDVLINLIAIKKGIDEGETTLIDVCNILRDIEYLNAKHQLEHVSEEYLQNRKFLLRILSVLALVEVLVCPEEADAS